MSKESHEFTIEANEVAKIIAEHLHANGHFKSGVWDVTNTTYTLNSNHSRVEKVTMTIEGEPFED